jgi:hypothetical protein
MGNLNPKGPAMPTLQNRPPASASTGANGVNSCGANTRLAGGPLPSTFEVRVSESGAVVYTSDNKIKALSTARGYVQRNDVSCDVYQVFRGPIAPRFVCGLLR